MNLKTALILYLVRSADGQSSSGSFKDRKKVRMKDLAKTVGEVQNRLDKLTLMEEATWSELESLQRRVENIESILDDLAGRMDVEARERRILREKFESEQLERKAEKELQRDGVNECVRYVMSRDYVKAEEMLKSIPEEQINYIIDQVYRNDSKNLDLVLEFCKKIRNDRKRFFVLKALETKKFEPDDSTNRFKVVMRVYDDLIRSPTVSASQKEEAQKLADVFMLNWKEMFVAAMKDDNMYELTKNVGIPRLFLNTETFDIYERLMKSVVGECYEMMELTQMMDFMLSSSYYSHWVLGFSAIFDEMSTRGDLDRKKTLIFAQNIKYMRNYYYYKYENPIIQKKLLDMKNNLPLSVKKNVFRGSF